MSGTGCPLSEEPPPEAPAGESLARIACRYLVMSKWSYENVSFVFQVQMSSTDTKQQRAPPALHPSGGPTTPPRPWTQWSAFCFASFSPNSIFICFAHSQFLCLYCVYFLPSPLPFGRKCF